MGEAEVLFEKLLKDNTLCVLATASLDGKPEAATIEYVSDADWNLYFETFPTYRKYANLKSNPQASVVITQDPHTIQMDGVVVELTGKESNNAKQLLIAKHGIGSGYYEDPAIRFFRFTPTWIRLLVEAKWPPKYVVIRGTGPKGLHTLHE
jgi:general stress protein 26